MKQGVWLIKLFFFLRKFSNLIFKKSMELIETQNNLLLPRCLSIWNFFKPTNQLFLVGKACSDHLFEAPYKLRDFPVEAHSSRNLTAVSHAHTPTFLRYKSRTVEAVVRLEINLVFKQGQLLCIALTSRVLPHWVFPQWGVN